MSNFMIISASVARMLPNDYVGFTFFVGSMAMMAASAFFFLSLNQFDKKWRTSVLVSGLITFIAAVHYFTCVIIGKHSKNRLRFSDMSIGY